MALVECATCGKKTAEGLFCEKCGADLVVAAGSVDPGPSSEALVREASAPPVSCSDAGLKPSYPLDEQSTGMETLGTESTPNVLRKELPRQSRPPVQPAPPVPKQNSCRYLNVDHDKSRVFVVGQTMNFRFALTPLVEGLSDVFVAVIFEGRGRKVEVKRLGWIPNEGERRELRNINFAAPEAGSLGFSFYFGFKKDDTDFVFEADGEHKVWPERARAADVVRNLEINIKNSGHASDFNLSGIREQLRPEESLADVIDRLHRLPPVWSGLRLYGSTWRPPRSRKRREGGHLVPVALETNPPPPARISRLTLKTDGRVVHLITGDTIRLGKNRQNDVVTRLFENGKATGPINSKISRHHCVIERQGKSCYLVDRGDYPGEGSRPSAYGAFLDGQRVPVRGRKELEPGKHVTMTMAGSSLDIPGVFGLELEAWTCGSAMRRYCRRDCESKQTAALVMRRRDRVPETYVALWECFSLGEGDPDFDGLVIWREDNAYAYATAESEGWLHPGMTIPTPQCEVQVEEWKQFGL
jgi:hypothetical protein